MDDSSNSDLQGSESNDTDAASRGNPSPVKKRSWTLVFVFFASVVAAYVGTQVWRRTGPEPPVLSLEGDDPAIANVLTQCRQAVDRNRRSGADWGRLGTALVVYERYEDAIVCLEHAEHYDGSNPRWPYFQGVALLNTDSETSLDCFRRAAELNQDAFPSTRLRLANLLAELGEYEEAAQHYRTVLEKWPLDPGATLGIGRISFAQGKVEESLEYLQRAAKSPFSARAAHTMLVTAYSRTGEDALANQCQEKLASLPRDRDMPDPFVEEASKLRVGLRAMVDYAALILSRGQLDEARPVAERAVRDYPESPEAWMLQSRVYLASQKMDEANDAASRAVKLAPNMVEAQMQLGVVHMLQNKLDEARRIFERAVQLKPDLGEAHHNLGLCMQVSGNLELAIASFRESIRLNSGFVDSYLGLADALAKSGDKEGARSAIFSARQLAPTDPRLQRIVDAHGLQL